MGFGGVGEVEREGLGELVLELGEPEVGAVGAGLVPEVDEGVVDGAVEGDEVEEAGGGSRGGDGGVEGQGEVFMECVGSGEGEKCQF